MFTTGLLSLVKHRQLSFKAPPLMVFITALFALWALFSSFWNRYNPNAALFESLIYVQLAVMVWLIWQLCRSERDHQILLQAFVLGAYVLVSTILYEFTTNPFVPNSQQSMQRYSSFGGNPNGVAALMALSLPVAWFLSLLQKKGFWYWINLLYLPSALFAIVLTASRGGFVIAVVGLLLVPLTYTSLERGRRVLVAAVLACLVAGIVSTVPLANFTRIADTTSELTEGNVSNRSQIWRAGLERFSERPLLGVGTGGFSRAVAPLLGASIPAHNAFITVLTEMGVVGFALFSLNLIVVLVPLFSLPPPHRTFYVVLWLALFVSLLPSNVENAQYVWALLALLATRRAYVLSPSLGETSGLERRAVLDRVG